MATTHRLDIEEEDFPFDFLGVSCADAGHRFCWNLNRNLGTRLTFHSELQVIHKKRLIQQLSNIILANFREKVRPHASSEHIFPCF